MPHPGVAGPDRAAPALRPLRRLACASIALALVGAGCAPARPGDPVSLERATIVRVIDGDTVVARVGRAGDERVRLIGMDTPETTGGRVEAFGRAATAFTRKAVEGATVYLEYDAGRRDRFGRLLAYVWTRSDPPDRGEESVRAWMLNGLLLEEGLAQTLTVPPNVAYAEVFARIQRRARAAGRGLWGAPGR